MTDELTGYLGGCTCGAVRYHARGEPKRVGICHCKRCRSETGAPFAAFAIFDRTQVTVESGETKAYQSTPTTERHFCRACGSPVFAADTIASELDVYFGSLDAPERLRPSYELWTIRRQDWLPEMPDLDHFERDRQG